MITNNINQERSFATPACRSAILHGSSVSVLGTFTALSLHRLGDGLGESRKKRGLGRGNICKCTAIVICVSVRTRAFLQLRIVHGITTRPCPGVTRDSLDFSHSLRGLSCLLQKHHLRYTIKPPVYNPAQFKDLRLFRRSFSRSFRVPAASFSHSFALSFPSALPPSVSRSSL